MALLTFFRFFATCAEGHFLNRLSTMEFFDSLLWIVFYVKYIGRIMLIYQDNKEFQLDNNDIDHSVKQDLTERGSLSGIESDPDTQEFPFDVDKISISSVPVPLSRLMDRLTKGTISAPAIQRSANLWDVQQQSRLIESLMLRIPLPLFYVAADGDENWKIVDGLQRVSSLRNFMIDNSFTLTGLEFLKELEGTSYKEIPSKYYNRITDTTLQFAVVSSTTPQEVQRNIFKRLNTGGLPLSQQEIRHALYYKENSAAFLQKLAEADVFKKATTYSIDDSRMAAKELVLRFISFFIRELHAYPKNDNMDTFLSDTMILLGEMPTLDESILAKLFQGKDTVTKCTYTTYESIEEHFNLAMLRATELFGRHAFRKSLPGSRRTPVNKALFETIAISLCNVSDMQFKLLCENKNEIFEKMREAFSDKLEHAISRDSHKFSAIKARFTFFENLFSDVWLGIYDRKN